MATLKKIVSGARPISGEKPIERIVIGLPGTPQEAIIHNGKIYIYDATGQTLINGGIIATEAIIANGITVEKLRTATKPFIANISWTAYSYNICNWGSGTIYWADGSTSTINPGGTGEMTNTTYIYYNGTSTLQKTTDYSIVTGNNVLMAIVELGNDGGKCVINPFFSTGTTIDADKVVTGKVESSDGKTYFDLDNGNIIVNDGEFDVLLIGYQQGGF